MVPLGKSHVVVGVPHIKKSRGRWAWMLAQGQSSSAKRGGLAVVSSGLIFLKKKKSKFIRRFKSLSPALARVPRDGAERRHLSRWRFPSQCKCLNKDSSYFSEFLSCLHFLKVT